MNEDTVRQAEFDGDVRTLGEAKPESKTHADGIKLSGRAYSVISLFPTVAFAVFTALMLAFIALLPVARVNALGLKEKYGSVLTATRFNEIAGLNGLSIALLVVAAITILYAIILLQHRFSVLKYREVLGRPLYKLLEAISVAFVLTHLIFVIAVIGKISEADGGLR